MSNETYGAKCFRCAHLEHRGEQSVEPQPWLGKVKCEDCDFCQEEALHTLIVGHGGIDLFDSETRAATKAFMKGEPHPLVDRLRWECLALDDQTVEVLGEPWKIVDAHHDGQHIHLTLVSGRDSQ